MADGNKLSETERKILEVLLHEKDVIHPDYTTISREIGVTPGTVKYNIRELKFRGVIKGFTAVVQDEDAAYLTIQARAGEYMKHPRSAPPGVVSEEYILEELFKNERIRDVCALPGFYVIIAKCGEKDAFELIQYLEDLGLELIDKGVALERRRRIGPYIVREGKGKGAYK